MEEIIEAYENESFFHRWHASGAPAVFPRCALPEGGRALRICPGLFSAFSNSHIFFVIVLIIVFFHDLFTPFSFHHEVGDDCNGYYDYSGT